MGQSVFAQSNLKITQGPILKNKVAKDNVFALFDDSTSIQKDIVYVSEHFNGYGSPRCEKPVNWAQIKQRPKYQNGRYYDPFVSGAYVPYDPLNKHKNYDGSIYVEQCSQINRGVAFGGLLKQFILYFNQSYLLGFGSTGQDYSAALSLNLDKSKEYAVVLNPVDDLSKYTNQQWSGLNFKISSTFNVNAMQNSWSPIFPALYNLSLYFRGHPLPVKMEHTTTGYKYKEYATPLKYRCAQNKIMLFTDGRPNRSYIDIFAGNDTHSLPSSLQSKLIFAESKVLNNGNLTITDTYPSLKATDLSNFFQNPNTQFAYIEDGYTGSEDGKVYDDSKLDRNRFDNATHKVYQKIFQGWMTQNLLDGHNAKNKPRTDLNGKQWSGTFSVPQTLSVNGIFFGNNPSKPLTNLIKETEGRQITQHGIDVNNMLEEISSELLGNQDRFTNGRPIEDQYMRTPDTIRYVFTHNIASNAGNIRAYQLEKRGSNFQWEDKPVWNMSQRSHPLDGRFMTMNYKNGSNPTPEQLSVDSVNFLYQDLYKKDISSEYLLWLEGISVFENVDNTVKTQFKPRHSMIGPIVNSAPAFLAKDREYINLNFFSDTLKNEFSQYVLAKANQMDSELLIVNANDGLVHFVKTDRKNQLPLGNGGVRTAAYFPGFLATRLPSIVDLDKPFAYSMDGAVGLFEFKGKDGNIQTVGLSGMGGGGKGIVGYQLLKMRGRTLDTSIQPLFEIVNEDGFKYKTDKFSDLGYTYSDFAFFNPSFNGSKNAGQGIAIFGNGLGEKESSLYVIDVENGKFLRKIELSSNGGGALTPALALTEDKDTGFQKIKYLVVGDQSGRLYKVDFTRGNVLNSVNLTVLYEPTAQGEKLFEHPITTKPFLYENKELEQEWVYFGTGRKVDQALDRGNASKHQQYFIAAPVNNPIALNNLNEIDFRISSNIVYLTNSQQKSEKGWYLKLAEGAYDLGNRLVYQPGMTKNGDIVFSTWGISEGDDSDFCSADIGSGLQIALNAETGEIGSFNSQGINVAGVQNRLTAPTLPSGSSITYQGYLGGQLDHGSMSTLDLEYIDRLNSQYSDTSHGVDAKHLSRCLATTNGESDKEMIEFCHDFEPKPLIKRRLSIQQLF